MAGKRDFTVLFRPDAHTSLGSYSWTRHHLILDVLDDVKSRLEVLTPQPGDWKRESIAGAPALSTVGVVDTDPDRCLLVTHSLLPGPSRIEKAVGR